MQEILNNIFKAYDIRGKVGSELTPEVVEQVGRALANWLPEQGTLAVGRDMRPDSAELATAMIAGLTSQGHDVWDIGEVTSDMIYFAVGDNDLAGGIMITASHNPGEYNGIKLCREGARPIGQDSGLFEVRDYAASKTFPDTPTKGKVTQKDLVEAWVTHVLTFVEADKLKPLNIAVDAGNGMAGKIFPEFEPYVPWDITEMYFELDGTFPNHEANPLKFETLNDIIKKIKDKNLDGGIAFDGDGDRAFLIDETGEVVGGAVMCAMLSEYFLQKFPGSAITYDLRTSHVVEEVIRENGGQPIRTKVGHSFIKKVMREHDAPFGGELSGHFYFRDNWYADSGLIAAVIGLYVATLRGKKLSELREQYTRYATTPETNFVVADKAAAIQAVEAAFPKAKVDKLDGITLELNEHTWLNVRPSNTEPVLRLNAEAETEKELDELVAKVTDLVSE